MRDAMSPEVKTALEQCRWMIKKGSKSFSLAARLFDPEIRDAAFFLYGWCRYCDDQVDQAGKTESPEELAKRVKALKDSTASAFSFAPQREPVFVALQ
jgi:phytoene synthase